MTDTASILKGGKKHMIVIMLRAMGANLLAGQPTLQH